MDKLKLLFLEILDVDFIDMVISGSKGSGAAKIKVRPVLVKGQLMFQVTRYVGNQVFHENAKGEILALQLAEEVFHDFKQVQIRTKTRAVSVLISKKGQVTVKNKKIEGPQAQLPDLDHNRKNPIFLKKAVLSRF